MNTNYFTHFPFWDKINRFVSKKLTDTKKNENSQPPPSDEKLIMTQAWNILESVDKSNLSFKNIASTSSRSIQEELNFWKDIAFVIRYNQLIKSYEKIDELPIVPLSKPWYTSWKTLSTGIAAGLTVFLTATTIYLVYLQINAKQNYAFLKDIPIYQNTFVQKMPAYQLLLKGQFQEAYESFQIAKDSIINEYGDTQETLMPDYIDLYQAITQIKLENYHSATRILEQLCGEEKETLDHPEHLYLGLLYFAKQNYARAEYHLEKAAASSGILTYIQKEDKVLTIAEIAEEYLDKIPNDQ